MNFWSNLKENYFHWRKIKDWLKLSENEKNKTKKCFELSVTIFCQPFLINQYSIISPIRFFSFFIDLTKLVTSLRPKLCILVFTISI